jgi:hypothetical protein
MGRPVVVDCLDLKTTIAKDGCAGVYKSGQWMPVAPGSKVPEKLILESEFQPTASAMTLQRRLSGTELHQEAYARAQEC